MRRIVFLGPSLDLATAEAILPEAIFLPPAGQAELASAVRRYQPRVVGLIDGYFHQQMAVWHKEILLALESGVHVYGASSIGALRAVEMAPFGMVGVGEVYRRYASGEIDADDEVALAHADGSSGFRGLSIPLVNIRATLDDGVAAGAVGEDEAREVVDAAASLYYPDRTVPLLGRVMVERGVDENRARAIEEWLREHYRDAKRNDAIELLETLRDLPDDLPPLTVDYEVERPHVLATMLERDVVYDRRGVGMSHADLAYHVALHMPEFTSFNFDALNRTLVVMMARLLEVEVDEEQIAAEERRHRLRLGLTDDQAFEDWCQDNDIVRAEYRKLMEEMALCRRMQRWLIGRRNYMGTARPIVDLLRIRGTYPEWAESFARQESFVAGELYEAVRACTETSTSLPDLVIEHLRATPCRMDAHFTEWAREAGFRDLSMLMTELIRSKLGREGLAEYVSSVAALLAESDDE